MPRESRNVYDHATRTLDVEIIEVDSAAELESALGPRTAMIQILGSHFGSSRFGLAEVAPIAKKAGVPILVDAAADYLIVPNPYIALGADLVAYSGGKIIRGPQTAGLLLGRKDLVRAAWANSAPHHAFGRAMKVSKEEIVGMVVAVETFVNKRNMQSEFKEWESWYAHISERITQVPGVKAQVRGPATRRAVPDVERVLGSGTGGAHGRRGRQASCSMASRASCRMLPVRELVRDSAGGDEARGLQDRRRPVGADLSRRSEGRQGDSTGRASVEIAGRWDVSVQYESGSAEHKLFLATKGNKVSGTHMGWAFEGDLSGSIDGDKVELRTALPAGGQRLTYGFSGRVTGDTMSRRSGSWRVRQGSLDSAASRMMVFDAKRLGCWRSRLRCSVDELVGRRPHGRKRGQLPHVFHCTSGARPDSARRCRRDQDGRFRRIRLSGRSAHKDSWQPSDWSFLRRGSRTWRCHRRATQPCPVESHDRVYRIIVSARSVPKLAISFRPPYTEGAVLPANGPGAFRHRSEGWYCASEGPAEQPGRPYVQCGADARVHRCCSGRE